MGEAQSVAASNADGTPIGLNLYASSSPDTGSSGIIRNEIDVLIEKMKMNEKQLIDGFFDQGQGTLQIDPSVLQVIREMIKAIEARKERISQLEGGAMPTQEEISYWRTIQGNIKFLSSKTNAVYNNSVEKCDDRKKTLERLIREKEVLQAKNNILRNQLMKKFHIIE